ncbi:Transcription initiation factor TFIID subunit 5 [Aspergillus fumigatus]
MSAPGGAPSPAPRSASIGPGGGGMSMPPQQPMGNTTPVGAPTPGPPPPPPSGAMSQQNLNQIVIDYLAKKGYSRTEAMLRMESANQEIDGRPLPPLGEDARPKYRMGFDILKAWVEDNLDLYKVGYFVIINTGNAYLWTART